MFDKADVGVMSNNAEKTFGLSSLADKFVFVAPDVKSDLVLDQAEVCISTFFKVHESIDVDPVLCLGMQLQSMITGGGYPKLKVCMSIYLSHLMN
jgi:hypothetical protein